MRYKTQFSQMPCSVHYKGAFSNTCKLIMAKKDMSKLNYENDEQRSHKTDFSQHSKIRYYATQKKGQGNSEWWTCHKSFMSLNQNKDNLFKQK